MDLDSITVTGGVVLFEFVDGNATSQLWRISIWIDPPTRLH